MTTDLDIQTKKIELIQWLSAIEDMSILDKIAGLIAHEQKSDWWGNTPEAAKNSIDKGIADAEKGNLHPHSKARDIYGKWL
jgi:predicted transcriptional regulator